jgi:hypothetical protein
LLKRRQVRQETLKQALAEVVTSVSNVANVTARLKFCYELSKPSFTLCFICEVAEISGSNLIPH